MGVVFEAEDLKLGRRVAVKFLPESRSLDSKALARFRREARAASALNHPHICTIHALEEDAGRSFIVMELLEGASLRHRLRLGRLPVEQVLEIGIQVARALVAAHRAGVVHRDLKPANLFLTDDGAVKVLDFGLAKFRALAVDAETETGSVTDALTVPGSAMGTVGYMSPEQVRGEELDERTDLFSLGVVLYEMATGRRPYRAPTPGLVVDRLLNHAPAVPSSVDPGLGPGLDSLLARALEKEPGLRYQSARELLVELERLRDAHAAGTRESVSGLGTAAGSVEDAPELLRQHRWREAYELLSRADPGGTLDAGALESLAEAAFWNGRHDECLRARERAFRGWLDSGNHERAAAIAAQLAETYRYRNAAAIARGWIRRALALIADLPRSAVRGYVTRVQAMIAIEFDRDYDRALELTREVAEIASETGDRVLWALATQDRGRTLVELGQTSEGVALMDEAMTAAVSGELPLEVSGKTFCNMIGVCESLADYRRASEWCQAAKDWCEPHGRSLFPGICRVHYAELLRLRGHWDAAAAEAESAGRELSSSLPTVAAEAFYQIGEILLRRGDLPGADASFRKAHEMGRNPLPGLALLRLAQGGRQAASSLVESALRERVGAPLARAKLLPARAEIALAEGDLTRASTVAEELEGLADGTGSSTLRAHARMVRGSVLLETGDFDAAVVELRSAVDLWKEVQVPFELACARELLGRACLQSSCPETAELELRAAEAGFESLGALADLTRLRSSTA